MYSFLYSTKLNASPYSDYYALIPEDEESAKTPVLIVVDKSKDNYIIVSQKNKNCNEKSAVSAVIVPDHDSINFELCKFILDTPYDKMKVVEIPLVAKRKGGIRTLTKTIREYN